MVKSVSNRPQKVAERVQRELAQLLQTEVRDPRLSFTTIADVKLTRDLSYATIYVTFLDDNYSAEERVRVLNQAAGFLRSLLSQKLSMRTVPELRFVYDVSQEQGRKIQSIIDAALAADNKKEPE